jgi:hypothetical protein
VRKNEKKVRNKMKCMIDDRKINKNLSKIKRKMRKMRKSEKKVRNQMKCMKDNRKIKINL